MLDLEEAIMVENFNKIHQLVGSRGTIIKETSVSSQTAIHLMFYKSFHGYFEPARECVEVLFSHRNNDINYIDENGLFHFHIACAIGNKKLANKFLEDGADVNMQYQPAGYDARKGFTPLHFAVEYAGIEMIELLINRGAATDSKDFLGRSPLHIACKFPRFNSASIQYPNSGYKHSDLSIEKMKNFLPAICEVHLNVVKLLLKHTYDLNPKDNSGNTPLFYVFQHNYPLIFLVIHKYVQ